MTIPARDNWTRILQGAQLQARSSQAHHTGSRILELARSQLRLEVQSELYIKTIDQRIRGRGNSQDAYSLNH